MRDSENHTRALEDFWNRKSLAEMTRKEWESLCDGCGICCLEKLEGKREGDVTVTSVACEYLDIEAGRCFIYEHRAELNPECIQLSPENVKKFPWLPDTCAYRRVSEGRELEEWHPLVSGDPSSVHKAGVSVCGKVLSGRFVNPRDFLLT